MARIRKGEKGARELLIRSNLKFVVSVCRNYQHQGLPLCDLINEGNLGLIRASLRFDESKNFKFISYAVWWIRQAILKALTEQSRIIRLPINRSGDLHKIGKIRSRLEQKLQRSPMYSEIAHELGVGIENVSDTLAVGDTHVSLDAPAGENNSSGLVELLKDKNQELPDRSVTDKMVNKRIETALKVLTEREAVIIKLYFGLGKSSPHTLEDIAKQLKLTRERIRQIKEKALLRLRKNRLLEHLNDGNL